MIIQVKSIRYGLKKKFMPLPWKRANNKLLSRQIENCLMPLCPTCIREHTEYHENNNSKPQYFNILETLADVQALLYNSIMTLEYDKRRNGELIKCIQSLDDLVKQKIMSTKTLVYNIVDEAFFELESELKINLAKLHQQIGLYSIKKCQKFDLHLNQTLDELYHLSEGLKSEKFLGNIIIYLKDLSVQGTNLHSKLTNYLQANENYEPKLEISNEAKNNIANIISRIIKIDGKRERDGKKTTKQEQKLSILKNQGNKIQGIDKIEKIQRSYTPQRSSAFLRPQTGDSSRANFNIPSISPTSAKFGIKHTQFGRMVTPVSYNVNHLQNENERVRDFKQEFEALSRKVSQMRRDNENTHKHYR